MPIPAPTGPNKVHTESDDHLRLQGELEQSRLALAAALARIEELTRDRRASQEFTNRLLDASRDCVKVLDLDGNLMSMNPGGMELLEICDLSQFIGKSWPDFWQGDDRRAAADALARARTGGVGRFTGYFQTLETRRPMWFDVLVSPILGPDGHPEQLLSVSRDVTEIRNAELALQRELQINEQITQLFRVVTQGSTGTGEAFFPAFARHLAEGLGVKYVFVASCVDAARTRVRMLAFWKRGRFAPPSEYDVAGTPCERVVMSGATCSYPDDVARLFPADTGLAEWGARGYLGMPLQDATGSIIGHLVLIDDQPFAAEPWLLSALQIFAARAGAELERLAADRLHRQAVAELEHARNRLQAENSYLRSEVDRQGGFTEIIGESPAMRRTLQQIEQVAPTNSTVLILGETGTGKELVARAIHQRSSRRGQPMVSINCGAISPGLVESELFGHEKGAFTGATSRRQGRFELADGGTIFLDEIGDLSLDLQVKLLRVLQEGEFNRVGGTAPIRVDVRVIAATHRDLGAAQRAGTFRQDLYYRLNVFPLRTPPLRDRLEDLPLLVEYFTRAYARRMGKRIEHIPAEVIDNLRRHAWPGNVRELANVIERSVIVTQGDTLQLAEWMTGSYQPVAVPTGELNASSTLQNIERAHILATLERTRWKVSGPGGAAELLNLKPTTLEARMKKLGIARPS
jgi:PAS domain S-box-containing protein